MKNPVTEFVNEIKDGAGWCTDNYVREFAHELTLVQKFEAMIKLAAAKILFEEDKLSEDELSEDSIPKRISPMTVADVNNLIKEEAKPKKKKFNSLNELKKYLEEEFSFDDIINSKKENCLKLRRGFFYTNGLTEDDFEKSVRKKLVDLDIEVYEAREFFNHWPKDSYWQVKVRIK